MGLRFIDFTSFPFQQSSFDFKHSSFHSVGDSKNIGHPVQHDAHEYNAWCENCSKDQIAMVGMRG